MGPNQTKSISMGPIWNTSGTETVITLAFPFRSWVLNGLGLKWAVFPHNSPKAEQFNSEVVRSQTSNEPEARHYYDSLKFCLEEIISIDLVKIKQQV